MDTYPNISVEALKKECIEHMQANGITFDGCLSCDGILHRFSMDSKKNKPDEWYCCHKEVSEKGLPYLVCNYGTWSDARDWFTFRSYDKNFQGISPQERREIQFKEGQRKKELEKQLQIEIKERVEKAQEIWQQSASSPTLDGHTDYLKRKQIDAHGVRYRVEYSGTSCIVIPIINVSGEIQAVQCISGDGIKRIHGAKKGNFHLIGEISTASLIYIAEGYATGASIYQATGNPVVVALDCGNIKPVVQTIKEKYPGVRVVIAADDDRGTDGNPGKTKALNAAKEYGCGVVIPTFPDDFRLPDGRFPSDFNDLHVHFGSDETGAQLQKLLPEVQKNGFQFRSAYSLIQEAPKANWLIKSYLDTGSLAVLFGEPGCMKSFLAIGMGCCIATGRDWHGFPVRKQGPVFYIAGEGFSGLSKRVKAWALANNVDLQDVPFFLSDRSAQFLDPTNVDEVIRAVEDLKNRYGQPVLIIIDTLNRNFGSGDENSTEDMTKFVNAVDSAIRIPYDCTVLIVHHTPLKDAKRARGASALRGALDWEYCLSKQGSDIRMLSPTKVKDHEPASDVFFRPRSVSLDDWVDEESGETMTSCVLEKVEGDAVSSKSSGIKLKGPQLVVFDCLMRLYESNGSQSEGVHIDDWRDAAYKAGVSQAGTSDAKKKAFQRAIQNLRISGFVEESKEYWKPCGTVERDGTFRGHVSDNNRGQTGHVSLDMSRCPDSQT